MEYAAYLLRENLDCKIGWVAETVGYCSLKHFNYVFKGYYDETPGQFQSRAENK
ncbi:MAG: AraC family transcriptional regulator [Clostridiales bacterium]|jgi:AraC-like DNA-binding protein|nr:AraC family transcriptional regulator [Clostridiales bacterium]